MKEREVEPIDFSLTFSIRLLFWWGSIMRDHSDGTNPKSQSMIVIKAFYLQIVYFGLGYKWIRF